MFQKRCHSLTNRLKYNNIITIDDIYEISEEHHIKIFSLYRYISELVKADKLKKVFIENTYDDLIIVQSKTFTSEIGFVLKRNSKLNPILSQNELDILLR